MAVRKIKPFLKQIETFIQNFNYAMDTNINIKPTRLDEVTATYEGDNIKFKFNSNHLDVVNKGKNPIVFLDIFYDFRGTEAGPIDLIDTTNSIDQVYGTLYELGFRTEQDLAREKEEQERKEREAKEEKLRKAEEDKAKKRAELDKYIKDRESEISDEDIEDDNFIAEDIEKNKIKFDKALSILTSNNEINSRMEVSINFNSDSNNYKMIYINIFYISSKNCLVQTEGVNPKIDKQTTWEKAKEYIFKVAEKVEGVVEINILNSEDEYLEIPEDGVDLDIDI